MSGGSAAMGQGKKRRSFLAAAESEELDMTPMMNILIILISFLVTMVVFTHLAVVKFSLPPTQSDEVAPAVTETATSAEVQQKDLTIVVSESGYQVLAEGQKFDAHPKGPKGYDFPALAKDLKALKALMPFNESVVLLIDSAVIYQDIISTMDLCRENQFPKVLLSGGLTE